MESSIGTPFIYREETLRPFFDYIKSGESFYLIGAPSSGKTRLLDLVTGTDPDALRIGLDYDRDWVKNKFLDKDSASKTWLVRVDMNRISQEGNWGFHFYELMLHSILLSCNKNRQTEDIDEITNELADLDAKVITSKDELMAYRLLEMAINKMCQVYKIKLCFLMDEFDDTYRAMSPGNFAHLRAIRDANKYQVSYVLSLRNLPENLRPPTQNEGFFELISDRMIGLGFYSKRDTFSIIEKWEKRLEQKLLPEQREWLWDYSGGHPGIARALFNLLTDTQSGAANNMSTEWLAKQESVREEFRKLWIGLMEDEQAALKHIALGDQPLKPIIRKQLLAKGLIKPLSNHDAFFTPILGHWLKK
jgi:hypothetical protein